MQFGNFETVFYSIRHASLCWMGLFCMEIHVYWVSLALYSPWIMLFCRYRLGVSCLFSISVHCLRFVMFLYKSFMKWTKEKKKIRKIEFIFQFQAFCNVTPVIMHCHLTQTAWLFASVYPLIWCELQGNSMQNRVLFSVILHSDFYWFL